MKDASAEKILNAYSVVDNIEKIASSGREIILSCGVADPFYKVKNEFRVNNGKGLPASSFRTDDWEIETK
jgi:hypothetical protein